MSVIVSDAVCSFVLPGYVCFSFSLLNSAGLSCKRDLDVSEITQLNKDYIYFLYLHFYIVVLALLL